MPCFLAITHYVFDGIARVIGFSTYKLFGRSKFPSCSKSQEICALTEVHFVRCIFLADFNDLLLHDFTFPKDLLELFEPFVTCVLLFDCFPIKVQKGNLKTTGKLRKLHTFNIYL